MTRFFANRWFGRRPWLRPDNPAETLAVMVVAVLSAYLMLVNLDYAALWHDEGTNAIMAHSLVTNGTLSGWDGRNLFFGSTFVNQHKYAIDNDLYLASYPPWPAFPSALGIILFGDGETGVRFFHALLGVLCLPVLYLLLRQNFPASPRLRVFAFAFFALSPIVILYVRQGRYYPDAIFFTLLCFYCYQRFWRGGRGGGAWLGGLVVFTTLNFLNHFAIGFTVAASLALWHLLLHLRATSRRQWLQLAVAGAAAMAACGGYLLMAGIIGGDSALEYGEGFYKTAWLERHVTLMGYYFRDLARSGWLPLWVALWWAYYLAVPFIASRASRAGTKHNKAARGESEGKDGGERDDRTVRHWALFAVLLVVTGSLISVQPLAQPIADLRYLVMALPFVLFLSAVCADWAWRKNKIAGGVVVAVLMTTNFAAWPFLMKDYHKHFGCPSERFVLPAMVREIHRPYPSAVAEAVTWLRANAARNDTVFVHPWADYAVLLYYLGDKLIFCCGLPDDAKLPREKIRALNVPVYASDAAPQWVVTMNGTATAPAGYRTVYSGQAFPYPTQRPELEYHCFAPPAGRTVAHIYRRKGE